MYVRTYACIQLASSAWNVSHDSVYMYTLETRRYPRETMDFIKLTVHARYSGVSLERREGKGREREKKKREKIPFLPLAFLPSVGRSLTRFTPGFTSPQILLPRYFSRCNSLTECFNVEIRSKQ